MSKLIVFIGVCFLGPCLLAQEGAPIIIGTQHQIYSQVLEEERVYWVSLPASYTQSEAAERQYPVLIILDGHLHFHSISGMVHSMSRSANRERGIAEMIVVAIQNVNRNRDFTPDKIVTTRKNDFGGGDDFLQFLEQELLPELEETYRTAPYRILFGHSLGGLLATHAYMKAETAFQAFLAVDPSMGSWDAARMDRKLEAMTKQSFERFFYLASANWGKRNLKNRDRHVRLYESLNSRCAGPFPGRLAYFEQENHQSVPVLAFYQGMMAVFAEHGAAYRMLSQKE